MIFTLIPILLEIFHDCYEFKIYGRVTHGSGLILRLAACLIMLLFDWKFIPLYIALHLLIFDHVMGYIVTGNPFYIGSQSDVDRFIRGNRYLSNLTVRTFLRIFLASILSSFYFFPEQWGL